MGYRCGLYKCKAGCWVDGIVGIGGVPGCVGGRSVFSRRGRALTRRWSEDSVLKGRLASGEQDLAVV